MTDSFGNIPKTGKKPKFSDTKVMALSLAAEFMSLDSENRLFNILNKSSFFIRHGHIERSVYNRRRRNLYYYYNELLDSLSMQLSPEENAFIIDSLPIEICRFARAKRIKICKTDQDTAPEFGYCAAQKNTYFGYKLHAICSITGVFRQVTISKANIADIHYLQDIRDNFTNSIIIGDKGYLSHEIQLDLFQKDGIRLFTPKRSNQKHNQYPPIFRKLRKRIETSFSQLCDQFMMKRNYAKNFIGLATRIMSKIVSLTVAQYQNKFVNHNHINFVKYAF
ncbi:IS982 family transposase [candidate division KSB1 bacterium]|nr:IS982 family transposase [candidate division KSB1 bacterium]